MHEQRVSDEQVAMAIRLHNDFYCAGPEMSEGVYIGDLALDLRDARNEIARLNGQTQYDPSAERLAQVEPVVRAAVAWAHSPSPATEDALYDAVDALPESVRKDYGTPPIDRDAPADPPAPAKDGVG